VVLINRLPQQTFFSTQHLSLQRMTFFCFKTKNQTDQDFVQDKTIKTQQ